MEAACACVEGETRSSKIVSAVGSATVGNAVSEGGLPELEVSAASFAWFVACCSAVIGAEASLMIRYRMGLALIAASAPDSELRIEMNASGNVDVGSYCNRGC